MLFDEIGVEIVVGVVVVEPRPVRGARAGAVAATSADNDARDDAAAVIVERRGPPPPAVELPSNAHGAGRVIAGHDERALDLISADGALPIMRQRRRPNPPRSMRRHATCRR